MVVLPRWRAVNQRDNSAVWRDRFPFYVAVFMVDADHHTIRCGWFDKLAERHGLVWYGVVQIVCVVMSCLNVRDLEFILVRIITSRVEYGIDDSVASPDPRFFLSRSRYTRDTVTAVHQGTERPSDEPGESTLPVSSSQARKKKRLAEHRSEATCFCRHRSHRRRTESKAQTVVIKTTQTVVTQIRITRDTYTLKVGR